jgi:PAS domain S-box-containing protein
MKNAEEPFGHHRAVSSKQGSEASLIAELSTVRKELRRLKTESELSSLAIVRLDIEAMGIDLNAQAESLLEVNGLCSRDFFTPELLRKFKLMSRGKEDEESFVHQVGKKEFQIEVRSIPEDAELVMRISELKISTNKSSLVAELETLHAKVEEQRRFYEFVLDKIPADIVVFDNKHHYMYINPLGVKDKELREWMIGKDDFDYCHFRGLPEKLAFDRRKLFDDVVARRETKEWEEEYSRDGRREVVLRKLSPLFDQDGNIEYVVGYAIDITSRKSAEERLEKTMHKLESVNTNLEALVQQKTDRIVEMTKSIAVHDKLATVGQLASGVAHDLNTPLASIGSAAVGVKYAMQQVFTGLLLQCTEMEVKLALKCTVEREGLKAYRSGREMRKSRKELESLLIETYGERVDITRFAKLLNKVQISPSEPDLIGRIVSSENPEILIDLISHLQDIRLFLDAIEHSSANAASVVEDLRAYIRNQPEGFKQEVNIADSIGTVLNIFSHEMRGRVELRTDIPDDLVVMGFDRKLFQLWSNLIKNAIQATTSSVTAQSRIKVRAKALGDFARIQIENTGDPIPDEVLPRIFDNQFTTKGEDGTGIGLSIVQNVVEAHQGKVSVESNSGRTIFTIDLRYE